MEKIWVVIPFFTIAAMVLCFLFGMLVGREIQKKKQPEEKNSAAAEENNVLPCHLDCETCIWNYKDMTGMECKLKKYRGRK